MALKFFEGENYVAQRRQQFLGKTEQQSSVSSWFLGLSSAFGSELSSTETKSGEKEEDNEFIGGLSRNMADYMLDEDDENFSPSLGSFLLIL